MRFAELRPQFSRVDERWESDFRIAPGGGKMSDPRLATFHVPAELADAQQVSFLCPACLVENKGIVGTHSVLVGFRDRGLLDHQSSRGRNGGPSRWIVAGTGIEDLTLAPSIDCGCWHGWITDGIVLHA